MKRLLGIAVLCACLVLPARAQDTPSPEALRAAQELASIITGDTVQQMTKALTAQMWPGIEAHFGGKVDAPTLADMRGEIERLLTKFVNDAMKEAPAIYARHFSVAEMHDLVALYKSPLGAKMLRELPKVTAETYGLVMPRLPAFQQEIAQSVQAVMTKHGYKN